MPLVVRRRTGGQWRTLAGAPRNTTLPDAPRVVDAVLGDASATAVWTPGDPGGSAVTSFQVTATPGGLSTTVGPSASSATLLGLTNGTTYTLTVRAINGVGTGPWSAPSPPVTPQVAEVVVRRTAANTGLAGVGLALENLTVWDCAVSGRDIPAGSYDQVWFKNIPTASTGPGIRLLADNMVFTKCAFTGADGWANPITGTRYLLNKGPGGAAALGKDGHQFFDCEFDGGGTMASTHYPASTTNPPPPFPISGNACMTAFQPGFSYAAVRCQFRRFEHHLQPQDVDVGRNVFVDACFFDEPMVVQYSGDVTHTDGFQVAGPGTRNLTIRYSTFDLYTPGGLVEVANTASLGIFGSFPKNPDGTNKAILENVDIYGNYINGGFTAAQMSKLNGLAVCQNAFIRNNRFGLQHNQIRNGSGSQLIATDGGTIVWSNNVWDVSGTNRSNVTVLADQVIP